MKTDSPVVIAISRQLGCGGSYLGRLVAHRLGYRYADREILKQACAALGLTDREVRDPEEKLTRMWQEILKLFALAGPESIYVPAPVPDATDRQLYDAGAVILKKMAGEYNCVIVGKGAAHILKGHPRLLRVFLHAPMEYRISRLMRLFDLATPEEARTRIEASDENRRKFNKSMSGVDWTDARNYDICINTGTVDPLEVREMIVSLAARMPR